MAKKKTVICIDRDGVLIYDEKYHLGRTNNWKSKIKVLPHVVEGLKLLNKLSNVAIYLVTNQPGVAIKDFPLLTFARAHEVCRYVVDLLKKKGGHLDGYFLCAHASPAYAKRRSNYKFDKKLVCNCSCIKPRFGMVYDALEKEGIKPEQATIYVMGDRATDIQTAINAGGVGVFVPFENEPGQKEKVKEIKQKSKVYIAKNFLDAVNFIIKKDVKH